MPAGRISDAIFSNPDLLPTISTLAGYETPTDRIIDGVDQSELLLGKSETGATEEFYYFSQDELHGLRKGKWKLLLPNRKKFYGYVDDRGTGAVELYDLDSDIGETRNLAGQHSKVVERMLAHAKAFEWPAGWR